MGNDGWIYAVLPFVTMAVLGAGLFVAVPAAGAARRNGRRGRAAEPGLPPRRATVAPARRGPGGATRCCGSASAWCSWCSGWVVWPGLFGGVFIFLPFVWVWRPRHDPRMDPRTNGHTSRDAGSFSGD